MSLKGFPLRQLTLNLKVGSGANVVVPRLKAVHIAFAPKEDNAQKDTSLASSTKPILESFMVNELTRLYAANPNLVVTTSTSSSSDTSNTITLEYLSPSKGDTQKLTIPSEDCKSPTHIYKRLIELVGSS